jgi:hypothetical protein
MSSKQKRFWTSLVFFPLLHPAALLELKFFGTSQGYDTSSNFGASLALAQVFKIEKILDIPSLLPTSSSCCLDGMENTFKSLPDYSRRGGKKNICQQNLISCNTCAVLRKCESSYRKAETEVLLTKFPQFRNKQKKLLIFPIYYRYPNITVNVFAQLYTLEYSVIRKYFHFFHELYSVSITSVICSSFHTSSLS